MKPLLTILLTVLLASCADKVPPRAIIAPETVVSAVDTAPVESSARAVSDGTERVIEANRKAREANNKAVDTSVQLRAAMERAHILTEGQELLKQAWEEAERFAVQLGNELIATQSALAESQTETDGLRESVKSLASEVSTLKASAAVNKSATDSIRSENKTLRAQAEQGNAARDDLLTLKATSKQSIDRLTRHRLLLALSTGTLTILLGIASYLLLKP
jgi:chromosome segregation ATPase